MTEFGKVLRQKGLTGREFAAKCGLCSSIIYKYMCGSRRLSYRTAAKLAKELGVKPEELLEKE